MIDSISVIERLTLVAPFGVRFRDEVSGSIVGDGLTVTAYPPINPARRVQAFANPSGVYVLRNVPGLRNFEHGAGDANFWNNLPPKRSFIIEVVDNARRFQSFRFTADLPVRGLFPWECGATASSPPTTPAMVPLYSAPTRPVPAGMAVLRAQLWDPIAQVYAAGAVIEVQLLGRPPVRGFADALGRIVLIFPYPEPTDFVLDSLPSASPVGASVPLTQHTWSIELRAAYAPQQPVPFIPDLCTTLMQSPAILWADKARTQHLPPVTLHFGQELVVRSTDTAHNTALPVLLITPAVSPP
ncbi:MAG: hypothetical protein ACJ8CB_03810 [Ktedonobacteraceae bacterium]